MRYALAVVVTAATLVTAAPAAAVTPHQPTPTVAADRQSDTERANAAARSSRAGQRGGAGPWLDSNYQPVWKRVSPGARSVWLCIRRHESIMAGHYRAANPVSSASGAGQWLDSTWRGVARYVKVHNEYVARRYSRAMYAPAWVQDAAFVHVYRHGGLSMWRGTGCSGT